MTIIIRIHLQFIIEILLFLPGMTQLILTRLWPVVSPFSVSRLSTCILSSFAIRTKSFPQCYFPLCNSEVLNFIPCFFALDQGKENQCGRFKNIHFIFYDAFYLFSKYLLNGFPWLFYSCQFYLSLSLSLPSVWVNKWRHFSPFN